MVTLETLINRLKTAPLGLTIPEVAELLSILQVVKNSHQNANSVTIIRAMDPKTALQFDEFIAFKAWKGGQQ